MNFLSALFSGDETAVDSIVVCGLVLTLTLAGIAIYMTIVEPQSFNPVTFSTGGSALIAATAAGKTARDRLSTSPPPAPGDQK